jgi:hypothetical protein
MSTPIRLKRSAIQDKRPLVSDLQLGELALNFYDGKLYAKKKHGGDESVIEIGNLLSELKVTGISTFSDIVDINAPTYIGRSGQESIRLGFTSTTKIDTTESELRLGSFGGTIHADDILDVHARLNVRGDGAEINNVRIGGTSTTNFITTVQPSDIVLDVSEGRKVLVKDNFSVVGVSTLTLGALVHAVGIGLTATNTITTINNDLILKSADELVSIQASLGVAGLSTFTDTVDINNGAYIDNITIGIDNDNRISTVADDLELSSATQNITLDSNVRVTNENLLSIGNELSELTINSDPEGSNINKMGGTSLKLNTEGGLIEFKISDEPILTLSQNPDGTVILYNQGVPTLEVNTQGINLSSSYNPDYSAITGPSEICIDPAGIGDNTGTVRIKGDLIVDGEQFIVDSSRIELADFNVGIASTVATNALLDGAGIGIGSTGIRKTLVYDTSSDALKSSENFDLVSGKVYKIGETEHLSSTHLTVPNYNVVGTGTVGILSATTVFGHIDGILNKPGNTWFVSTNGNDSHIGDDYNQQFLTLEHALSVAQYGDIIDIASGDYEEVCPLTVPAGVTIKGSSIRSTSIIPTDATKTQDIFKLNNLSTIEDLTIRGCCYDSINDTGYAFSYDVGIAITTRSPYIQRVTVLNRGSVVSSSDPYGFDTADAGRGAKVDGSLVDPSSIEAGMLFNEVTFFTPNQKGLVMTNGARVEYLNCFHYFADEGICGVAGTTGIGGNANARVRVVGLSTIPTANDVIKLYSGGVGVATGTVVSHDSGLITISGKGTGKFSSNVGTGTTQDVRIFQSDGTTQVGTADTITFADYKMFGAEIRSVSCAFEYGNKGVVADGNGVQLRLFAANFNHIGSGKDFSNDDTLVVQDNEISEINDGQISYVSIDQKGDFRVGETFFVDQETGNVSFAATTGMTVANAFTVVGGGNTMTITDDSITTTEVLTLDTNAGRVDINDRLHVTGVSTFFERVIFDSTNSIQIPVGNVVERDSVGTAVTGQIRYNSEYSTFEGFGPGNAWGSLGGVKDVDQDTYIVPETGPGTDEDILYFYNDGTNSAQLSETHFQLNTHLNATGVVTATSFYGEGGALTLGGQYTPVDAPTDGDYIGGAAINTFNGNTKIVDSIDELNELAFNIVRNTAVTEVDFVSTPEVGGSPLNVSLNITHSGNANRYDVTWGDGTQSLDQSASTIAHTYTQPNGAILPITVTARNNTGVGAGHSQTLLKSDYITIYTPDPVVDFDFFAASSGGSALNLWDDGDIVHFENDTTNVSGFAVDYTVNYGDGSSDQISSNAVPGGVGGGRTSHTFTNATETDTVYSVVTTLNSHPAADPAVIPSTDTQTFKVYSEHTPSFDTTTLVGINSLSASGFPVVFTNTTEDTVGSFATFGNTYTWTWGDGTTNDINVGSNSAGDNDVDISHTFALNASQQISGVTSTFNADLTLFTSHTSSPFVATNVTISVEPEVRSIFAGVATVISDRTGDNSQDLYSGVDLFGEDRSVGNFTNTSHNGEDYVYAWGDGTSNDVIPDNVSAGGTSATIDHSFQGSAGNKTVTLTANGTPGTLVQNGRTSIVTMELHDVPAAPTAITSVNLSMNTSSQGSSPYLCAGATRNESGVGIETGSSVIRYVTTTPIRTNYISNINGSHTGTLSAKLNGVDTGSKAFTTATSESGIFDDLEISGEGDAHDKISASTYPSRFYQVFTARVSKPLSEISDGVNDYGLAHSTLGTAGITTFVKDDLNTTPTTSAGTLSESSGGTKRYISGIPYYDSGGPTLTMTGATVTNFTGQTYQNTTTPVNIDAGSNYESTSGSIISTNNYTYAQVDGATTFIDSTYNVPLADTGVGSPYTFGSLLIPITSNSIRSVQDIKIRAKNPTGTGLYATNSTKVQVHTTEQSGISEILIAVTDSLGNGVYTDDGVRIFDFSSDTTDNPSYTSSTNFYTNSPYTESGDPGVAGTKEATIRLGVLEHNVVDYSTGFLPVGPDRSGDTGTQYFTFAFRRQVVANFDINITSTSGVAGVWIAAPGTQIDTTSGLNGWLRADTPYAGSGIPGSGTGGNSSDGCASNSGDRILPSTALSGGYTMTLGSENMSNATGNVVLVRIALTSGQSITNLSVGEAN